MKYKLIFAHAGDAPVKFEKSHHYIRPHWTRTGQIYTGHNEAEAELMAGKLGLSKEALMPPPPKSDPAKPNDPRGSFWKTFSIAVGNDGVHLDTDNPFDELTWRFLAKHHRVASSVAKANASHWYILLDEELEATSKITNAKKKIRAMEIYAAMSPVEIRQAVRVMGHPEVDGMSASMAEGLLLDLIEKDVTRFMTLWGENADRLHAAWVEEAVRLTIIRRDLNRYYYGPDLIASNFQDAVRWKKADVNKNAVIAISREIEMKTKGKLNDDTSVLLPPGPKKPSVLKGAAKLAAERKKAKEQTEEPKTDETDNQPVA